MRFKLIPLVLISHALLAQGHIEDRLEFSQEASSYFSEELMLPSLPKNPHINNASKVKVEAFYCEESAIWTIVFHFPLSVTVKQQVFLNAFSLEFNQPLDSPDLVTVQDKIGTLVKRFSNGYNTLYIEWHNPQIYSVHAEEKKVILQIEPDFDAHLEENKDASLGLARWAYEVRDYNLAFEELAAIDMDYPNDKEARVLASSLEGQIPRWIRQVNILESLHQEYPHDEDVTTLLYQAFSPHSSFNQVERQIQRTVGLAIVQVYKFRKESLYKMSPFSVLYSGLDFQVWDGHISGIVDSSGNTVPFRGSRCRIALYLRKEWEDGNTLKTSIYDQEGAFGFGVEASTLVPALQGTFIASADWHRPLWEIFEALAFHGREDRFYLQLNSVTNCYLSWTLGSGMRRVGITGTPNGYTSVLVASNVILNAAIQNPLVGVSYSVDAEYVTSITTEISSAGTPFNPVPYTSFEFHTLRANIFYIYQDRWYITVYCGETFNRLGINSPTYGAEIRYAKPIPEGFEATLSGYRFPSTTVAGASATYLTGTLTFRF